MAVGRAIAVEPHLQGIILLSFVAGLTLAPASVAQTATAASTTAGQSQTRSAAKISPRLAQAESLIQLQSYAQAKNLLNEEIAQNPANVDALNLLGIACTGEKDYEGAQAAFTNALALAPTSTTTHNNLGSLYVAEQKSDLAEKEFSTVLLASPENANANYNLALILLAKGKSAEAIAHLRRVRPATVESQFNLVRAYLQGGKNAEALATSRALSLAHKQDVQLHFTLGLLFATAKQYKTAESELEQANALQPETFEILHNLGQAYLRAHEYAKAELVLNRALKIKPDSAEALYLLAQVNSEQARPLDALELLVRARKLAPDNTDIIFLMARVSMTQNYFEDAIPLLESGVAIAPQRPDLHAALGESYFMAGKTEKAIAEFQKLIELDPSARSYAFMGLSYRHLGRFDEARKYFDEGLKLDPHNTSCLFNVGFIEERQGNDAKAEDYFQRALNVNSDFPEALLELANLRMKNKKFADAVDLLHRYVKISRDPADGYYKLAMAERGLHQTAAAQRDLSVFQTLSKNTKAGPYPYQHLFDYVDNRAQLTPKEQTQLDVTQLKEQIEKHPGQPRDLYALAETYLKLGQVAEARNAIAQLDPMIAKDYRTQAGVGVLLARYRMYDDAIQHFQAALRENPESDDVKFDLTDAYFRKGQYPAALETAHTVSAAGQQDDAFLSLLGDIEAHVGDTAKAIDIYRDAIGRNPDNDQYYVALMMVQLRVADVNGAEQTLQKGLARIPASGKIMWGLGLIAVLRGNSTEAAIRLERALDLLPEWVGSYSTLGIFYYQTGQIDKAREVLNRFKGSNAGGLDVNRIEQVLAKAPAQPETPDHALPVEARQQVVQMALLIADRSL